MNKKIVEIIAGIIFLIACLGALAWFYFSYQANYIREQISAAPSISLKKISVSELENIESNSLSALKKLKIFGQIPVRASGDERSKTNLFAEEDKDNEKGKFIANKYSLEYPGSWIQNIQKNEDSTNIIFEAPIESGALKTKGTVLIIENNSSAKDHKALEKTLKSQLVTSLGLQAKDQTGYSIETSDSDRANGTMRGRIKFSYKDGKDTIKGWIGGLSHQSPSKSLSEKIYTLIVSNQDKSTFFKQIAPTIKNSQAGMSKILQNQAVINELSSLGKDINYNIKPYDVVIMFIFESKQNNYDSLKSDADHIYTHTNFIETASGSALK